MEPLSLLLHCRQTRPRQTPREQHPHQHRSVGGWSRVSTTAAAGSSSGNGRGDDAVNGRGDDAAVEGRDGAGLGEGLSSTSTIKGDSGTFSSTRPACTGDPTAKLTGEDGRIDTLGGNGGALSLHYCEAMKHAGLKLARLSRHGPGGYDFGTVEGKENSVRTQRTCTGVGKSLRHDTM